MKAVADDYSQSSPFPHSGYTICCSPSSQQDVQISQSNTGSPQLKLLDRKGWGNRRAFDTLKGVQSNAVESNGKWSHGKDTPSGSSSRSPRIVPTLFWLGGEAPSKIDCRKKGTLILNCLLEDLVMASSYS